MTTKRWPINLSLPTLQQTIGNLQASNTTLTTRIATLLEAENTTLTTANMPSRLKLQTSQEALRLAALPKLVQELPPQSSLQHLLQWSITKI
jgi:hypothetical protein